MGVVSISGIDVTVYGDQSEAQDYFKTSLQGTVFTGAESNTQKQSLVSATRWMDTLGLQDPSTGQSIAPSVDDTGVPLEVRQGAYELARALIADPSILGNRENGGSNIKNVGAGSARVEFFRPQSGTAFPTVAMRILAPYISGPSSSLYGCATGTDGESSFKDATAPGLTEGYS